MRLENGPKYFARRLLLYVLGMFILALGVGFAVRSNLGISPVNSIPYVLSRCLNKDQGPLTTIVFCIFVLLQAVILKKEFKPVQLLQVACAALFGCFISFCNSIMSGLDLNSYIARLGFTVVSIFLIAAGMFLYLAAELIPQPAEGLCLAIQRKYGFKYSNIKVIIDCSLVAIAALVALILTGSVAGIREGTLITMLTAGRLIGFFMDKLGSKVRRFCFGGEGQK